MRIENHASAILATATTFGGSLSRKNHWKPAKNIIVHGYLTVSIADGKIILRKSLCEIDAYTPIGDRYNLRSTEQAVPSLSLASVHPST